jgi:type I restriction enzyme S subunit
VIPKDWTFKLLPEVCKFRGGKAHEQFVSELGKYVCVNSKFISSNGQVKKYATANICPAKTNDIMMVMSDLPNGKALAKAFVADQDDLYAVNQRVCALTPYRDNAKYLFYALNRNPYFLKFDDGVSQTHLLNPVFMKCPVVMPSSVKEQQDIACALSDADTLIDSLEQLLTKKRQIKQGAMQELLTGKRRLPGFVQPWNDSKMGQLGTFLKGSGIKRDEALSGDLPCVRYGEIYTTHSDIIRQCSSWISPTVASSATLLRQGDLLFAGSGETKEEIGKCVAFLDDKPAYAGGDIVILRPTVEADSAFLGYLLNMPSVVRQKASRGQGDAVVHISAKALGEIDLKLPEALEQAAISKVLLDMDSELATLEVRLTKVRALKQAMAQALLTGSIRLVERTK